MGKIIVIPLVAMFAFVAAMGIPMIMSGNLNMEGINRILGRETASTSAVPPEDDFGPRALALKKERESLAKRKAELDTLDEQLRQRQQVLDDTLKEIQQIQEQLEAAMDDMDTGQAAGVEQVAKTVAAMNDVNAAKSLESMAPEEAAHILPLIKERTRGRIMDSMDDRRRALILQIMQERKY